MNIFGPFARTSSRGSRNLRSRVATREEERSGFCFSDTLQARGDSEYSAHGRPRARSHRQCWPESTHCKWPCRWVSMYTPQPSSINIAQGLGRGDNSWVPPRPTESETGGAAQVTRSLPSPTRDSDTDSSLRTTNLLRSDPTFPGTESISCCPWPSCCSHTAHQRQFRRAGPTTYQHSS